LGNLIGLAAGIGRGISIHFIKRSAVRNHPAVVYLSACFWGMWLLPFTASQVAQTTWAPSLLLLLIGTLAFVGQMFMTHGIRYVNTIKASLLAYSTIPLTIFFGFLIGEELHGRFFLGIVFIMSGLIFNSGIIEKQLMSPRRESL
jgi:drug/metabolite transporter (DMT)-like permease